MKPFIFLLLYLISIANVHADPVLVPTPSSPLIFQVNGPTITVTLTNTGPTLGAAFIDTSNFAPYFTVSNDTCALETGMLVGNSCTFDLTPLLNVSLPILTTISIPYEGVLIFKKETFMIPLNINIDVAILQVGDTWQGGVIYQISQLANTNATGTTVAPNVSTGSWSLATCTGFSGGGQNNWTMPTITDLDTIWPLSNCNGGVVTGFNCSSNIFYWSSTILNPPPPTNDGSFYVEVKNFGRNCNGADKNIRSHITSCIRTF